MKHLSKFNENRNDLDFETFKELMYDITDEFNDYRCDDNGDHYQCILHNIFNELNVYYNEDEESILGGFSFTMKLFDEGMMSEEIDDMFEYDIQNLIKIIKQDEYKFMTTKQYVISQIDKYMKNLKVMKQISNKFNRISAILSKYNNIDECKMLFGKMRDENEDTNLIFLINLK